MTLAPQGSPEEDRRLLDDYYALEQSWAADRVANVASAARAQIDDAMRSMPIEVDIDRPIDLTDGSKVDRSIDGRSIDGRSTAAAAGNRSTSTDNSSRASSGTPKARDDENDDDDEEARSTLVSKGTRKKRPGEDAPPKLPPEQLQRSVLAALKEIDPTRDERDKRSDSRATKPLIGQGGGGGGGADDDVDVDSGGGGGGGSKWWKRRFRAIYLPTVHSGGAAGFLQVDISSDGNAKDVRVVAFEDRYDAMACVATMAEIESFKASGSKFSVGALPTDKVELELREAYLRQKADGGGASPPSDVLVFRKGKLPLRVGMTEEEFVRILVLQGTAQVSLLSSGFQF